MADVEMTDAAAAAPEQKVKSSKGEGSSGDKKRFEVKKVRCRNQESDIQNLS